MEFDFQGPEKNFFLSDKDLLKFRSEPYRVLLYKSLEFLKKSYITSLTRKTLRLFLSVLTKLPIPEDDKKQIKYLKQSLKSTYRKLTKDELCLLSVISDKYFQALILQKPIDSLKPTVIEFQKLQPKDRQLEPYYDLIFNTHSDLLEVLIKAGVHAWSPMGYKLRVESFEPLEKFSEIFTEYWQKKPISKKYPSQIVLSCLVYNESQPRIGQLDSLC